MLIPLVFLIFLFQLSHAQLEIRACCGGDTGTCQSFTRPEDLFGTACCDVKPYNTYKELCCSGAVKEKNRGGAFAELCCGTEVLRYDQTCCDGVVHNVINGNCCGQAVYIKADRTMLCCNGTLVRTTSPSDICCGSDVFDGGRNQICCGDSVVEKAAFDSCCQMVNGTSVPYKSQTQFCCDGAVPKGQNMSCCYVRDRVTAQVTPTHYNYNTECCKYPYDRLYSRSVDGTCAG